MYWCEWWQVDGWRGVNHGSTFMTFDILLCFFSGLGHFFIFAVVVIFSILLLPSSNTSVDCAAIWRLWFSVRGYVEVFETSSQQPGFQIEAEESASV